MEEVDNKLDLITEIWNSFILESKFCQSRINYTADVKSNYYGDLIHYLSDTFPLIEFSQGKNSPQQEIFQSTSVLQLMYVQQDIVEELLYIFKFDKDMLLSECLFRKQNRDIRNELVGHPIGRSKIEGNRLISSVLFESEPELGRLEYIIYSAENNFSGKKKSFLKSEIVSNHKKFLNKYFDIILSKAYKILNDYLEEHIKFHETIFHKLTVPKLVAYLECKFEYVFNTRTLSNAEEIIEIYELKDENLRYDYALNEFLRSIEISILNRITIIQEITKINVYSGDKEKLSELKEIDCLVDNNLNNGGYNFRYKLSKLLERHPVFKIESFKKEFVEESRILKELECMEDNIDNDLRYKCGWLFLKKLISERGKPTTNLDLNTAHP